MEARTLVPYGYFRVVQIQFLVFCDAYKKDLNHPMLLLLANQGGTGMTFMIDQIKKIIDFFLYDKNFMT